MTDQKYNVTIKFVTRAGRVVGEIQEITVTQKRPNLFCGNGVDVYVPCGRPYVSGTLYISIPIEAEFLADHTFGNPNCLPQPLDIVIDTATSKSTLRSVGLFFNLKSGHEAYPEQLVNFTGKLEYECDSIQVESKINE